MKSAHSIQTAGLFGTSGMSVAGIKNARSYDAEELFLTAGASGTVSSACHRLFATAESKLRQRIAETEPERALSAEAEFRRRLATEPAVVQICHDSPVAGSIVEETQSLAGGAPVSDEHYTMNVKRRWPECVGGPSKCHSVLCCFGGASTDVAKDEATSSAAII